MRLAAPLLLIALPLAEIAGFVVVGRQIGALGTIGLVVAAAAAGLLLLRVQGVRAAGRIRQAAAGGRIAGEDMANGAMVMLAGLLLLVPGFITDIVGLLLFIPQLRRFIWRRLGKHITVATARFRPDAWPGGNGGPTVDLDPDDYSRTNAPASPRKRLATGSEG
ncbi:MAG: FxsA family protein [Rhizobiaceae bacterium]